MTTNNEVFKLPDFIELSSFPDYPIYQEAIYQIFKSEFVDSKPKADKPIRVKYHPRSHNKEKAFWHLISEEDQTLPGEENRVVNLDRCRKIRWIKFLIESKDSEHVKCWRNTRKGKSHLLISLLDFSYLVVLTDNRNEDYYLLLSAYPIERTKKKLALSKEYQEYIDSKNK